MNESRFVADAVRPGPLLIRAERFARALSTVYPYSFEWCLEQLLALVLVQELPERVARRHLRLELEMRLSCSAPLGRFRLLRRRGSISGDPIA